MNRAEAEAMVAPKIFQVKQYRAVGCEDALSLLGDDLFACLLDDRIRNAGPTEGTFYPWNVVDVLQNQ